MPMSRRVSCHHGPCRPMFPCRMSPYSHADIPFKSPHRNSGCVGVPPIGEGSSWFTVIGIQTVRTLSPLPTTRPVGLRVEKRVKAEPERKLKRQLLHRPTDEARPAGVGPHTHTTKYSTRCRAPFRRGGENSS